MWTGTAAGWLKNMNKLMAANGQIKRDGAICQLKMDMVEVVQKPIAIPSFFFFCFVFKNSEDGGGREKELGGTEGLLAMASWKAGGRLPFSAYVMVAKCASSSFQFSSNSSIPPCFFFLPPSGPASFPFHSIPSPSSPPQLAPSPIGQ